MTLTRSPTHRAAGLLAATAAQDDVRSDPVFERLRAVEDGDPSTKVEQPR